MNKQLASILLWLTSILWGLGYIGTDLLLDAGMDPFLLIFMRFAIASIALTLIFIKKLNYTLKEVFYTSIVGLALFLAFSTQTIALNYTSTSNVSVITSLNLIFVSLFSVVILKGKITMKHILSIVLMILGTLILTGGVSNFTFGDFLTVICALFFGLHIVLISLYSKHVDITKLAVGQMYVTSILALIVSLLISTPIISQLQSADTLLMLFVGLIPSALCFFMQNVGIKHLDVNTGSLILATEAFWGVLFAILILHETLTIYIVFGSIFIFASTILDTLKK